MNNSLPPLRNNSKTHWYGMVWFSVICLLSPKKGHSCGAKNQSRRNIANLTHPKRRGPADTTPGVTPATCTERGSVQSPSMVVGL